MMRWRGIAHALLPALVAWAALLWCLWRLWQGWG